MHELQSELAVALQLEKDRASLYKFQRELQTHRLHVVNPSAPPAERKVFKATGALIDELLSLSHCLLLLALLQRSVLFQVVSRGLHLRRTTDDEVHPVLPISKTMTIPREFSNQEFREERVHDDNQTTGDIIDESDLEGIFVGCFQRDSNSILLRSQMLTTSFHN